ncbi:hypothetical protein BLNAU_10599 [Blattamonas nauphoetae]|uniref:Uncharacterized protein n=1 Tax=Blattamonas nauphoetae TaxID=2049346 RepID=A0ABQ9XT02_9EUKA|nr:hypothetical protein BLNAU_10599 [Blattamonas nauphoetae]
MSRTSLRILESPGNLSAFLVNSYHFISQQVSAIEVVFNPPHFYALFANLVRRLASDGLCVLPESSEFLVVDSEPSVQMLGIFINILEFYNTQKLVNDFDTFEHWKSLLARVSDRKEVLTDLSFLQSSSFRPTLLSLQKTYQNRFNNRMSQTTLQNPKSDRMNAEHPFNAAEALTLHNNSSEMLDSLPSFDKSSVLSPPLPPTATATSSSSLSLQAQPPPSHISSLQLTDPANDPLDVLTVIHHLLAAPVQPDNTHPRRVIKHVHQILYRESDLDPNMIFTEAIFDEDDITLLRRIARCQKLCEERNNLNCIENPFHFLTLLLPLLNSDDLSIRTRTRDLCKTILTHLRISPSADGPLRPTRLAFFDFDGLLAIDLKVIDSWDHLALLRQLSVEFVVWLFFAPPSPTHPQAWLSAFLLRFEHAHQHVAYAVSSLRTMQKQGFVRYDPFDIDLVYLQFLSCQHGVQFPPTYTTHLVNHPELHVQPVAIHPFMSSHHTSLHPKYRKKVYPMDLFFERQLRSKPNQLFNYKLADFIKLSKRHLCSPLVALHSLFLRGQHFSFSRPDRVSLWLMIVIMHQGIFSSDVDAFETLCRFFPPPRLIGLFVSDESTLVRREGMWEVQLEHLRRLFLCTVPFGDCVSLASFFGMLSPVDSSEKEVLRLNQTRDALIDLHWASIPTGFDSPLLARLPALLSCQRELLPSILRQTELASLVKLNDRAPSKPQRRTFENFTIVDQSGHARFTRFAVILA